VDKETIRRIYVYGVDIIMLLVGLQNCAGCREMHEKHPELSYIEIPRRVEFADRDIYPIKIAIGRLGIKEFPVILNDSLTSVLPFSTIGEKDPNEK